MEPSTEQVQYPIHLAGLTTWAGPRSILPKKFMKNIHKNSRLMQLLGYVKLTDPNDYGQTEPRLAQRTQELLRDPKFLRLLEWTRPLLGHFKTQTQSMTVKGMDKSFNNWFFQVYFGFQQASRIHSDLVVSKHLLFCCKWVEKHVPNFSLDIYIV